MIPVYIFCLTILFTSVIKVTDVFMELDKSLTARRVEFIKKTKSLHQNEKGSITLIAILFTLMISALLMFFALKNKVELKEVQYRSDSYLCFHSLNIETEKYIKDISNFNITLRALYAAQFAPNATAAARALFQATTAMRDSRHFFYVKNLLYNHYCKDKAESLSYLKHIPYETSSSLFLQTNIDETTKLKAREWKVTHYKSPHGIRLKNSFCLEATMQAEGPFFPNFKIKTAEIAMEGFSKLKCSSGFL
jgi:hypothetical protein